MSPFRGSMRRQPQAPVRVDRGLWVVSRVGCSALRLGRGAGGAGHQLLGVVLVGGRDLAKLRLVGSAVVGAKEQFPAGGQRYADVGLSATAVATVRARQRRVRGKS